METYDKLRLLRSIVDALSTSYAAGQQAEREKGCETCWHRWPREDKADLCGVASIYDGHSVAQVSCARLGYRCGAWEAKP
jgi:hypothetical protein